MVNAQYKVVWVKNGKKRIATRRAKRLSPTEAKLMRKLLKYKKRSKRFGRLRLERV